MEGVNILSTLKVFHRVVGDPPSRGFDDSLISPNFPVNAALAGIKSARIPLIGALGQAHGSSSTSLSEQHRVFEVQSLPFGQVMVIHSVVGALAGSRAHAYTNFALPLPEGEQKPVLTRYLSAEKLLLFDGFLGLEWFWGLDKTSKALPVSTWDPPSESHFSFDGHISSDFLDALLIAYWKSMSQRSFTGKTTPLRLCLGSLTDPQSIILQAKALLIDQILRNLPRAVENILSISMPVSNQHIMQKFPDSALVIVYPEAQIKYEFDLRSQQVSVHPDQDEISFIQHIRQEGSLPLLMEMIKPYQVLAGGDADDCPLMADYAFALSSFRAERNLLSPKEVLPLWKKLYDRLAGGYHGIQHEEQIDAVMRPMTIRLLDWFNQELDKLPRQEKEALPLSGEEAQFLAYKALTLRGEVQETVIQALAKLQALSQDTFITELLLNDQETTTKNETSAAMLLQTVLEAGFIDIFPGKNQRSALIGNEFVELMKGHHQLYQTMASYTVRLSQAHPDKDLLTLPLAVRYPSILGEEVAERHLSARDALMHAGQLLKEQYLISLPDEAQADSLQDALSMADEDTIRVLNEYLSDSFLAHQEDPQFVFSLAERLSINNKDALILAFDKAAQKQPNNQVLQLPWGLIQEMQKGFLRGNPLPSEAKQSLEHYLNAYVEETGSWSALGYLATCPLHEDTFSTARFIPTTGIGHVLQSMNNDQRLPNPQQFEVFQNWVIQIADHEPEVLDKITTAYEHALSFADLDKQTDWKSQAERLSGLLQLDAQSTPELRKIALGMIQEDFKKRLNGDGFISASHSIQDRLNKADVKPSDLLSSRDVQETMDKRLAYEFSVPSTLEEFTRIASEFEAQRFNAAYESYWKRALTDSLEKKKVQLFLSDACKNLNDLRALANFIQAKSVRGIDDEWLNLPIELSSEINLALQSGDKFVLHDKMKMFLNRLINLDDSPDSNLVKKIKLLIQQEYWKSKNDVTADMLDFYGQTGLALFCQLSGKGCFDTPKLLMMMAPAGHRKNIIPKDPYSSAGLPFLSTVTALFEALEKYGPGYSLHLAKSLKGEGSHGFDGDTVQQLRAYRCLLTKNKKNYYRFFPKPIQAEGLKHWLDNY